MQYIDYKQGLGIFARPAVMESAKNFSAWKWWTANGRSVPQLMKVAIKVLSQVVSSCSCERVNSEADYIKGLKANRMLHVNHTKIINIHHNLRLHHQVSDIKYSEKVHAWDDDDEEVVEVELD